MSESLIATQVVEPKVSAGLSSSPTEPLNPNHEANLTSLHVHRLLTVTAALGLFGAAFATWSAIVQVPLLGLVSMTAFGGILATVALCVLARTHSTLERLDLTVLVLALVLLGAWAASQLYFFPAYGTDEAAFQQFAAQLLMHGHNPYATSMLPALTQFRVPIQYATYTLNGSVSSTLAYPPLSFLVGIPFVWLSHGVQSVIIGNVVFLGLQMVLLFLFLPRPLRVLAPIVVVGLPILFGYSVAGVNDTLLVVFLLVVAWRWTDIGRTGALGSAGILRALCLGLALSVQQLSWFVLPFVIVGIFLVRTRDLGYRQALGVTGRYFLIASGTFLAINLPFIAWGADAWAKGVLTPFTQRAIPYGQGLIDLTVFFRIGGGNLLYYTYASAAILLGLLAVYVVFFDRLWRAAFMLPSAALFFPTRSLAEYFMTVIAIWVVSMISPGLGPQPVGRNNIDCITSRSRRVLTKGKRPHRWRWGVAVGSFIPGMLLVALALTSTAPLKLAIRSVETNGQLQGAWRIRVEVTNESAQAIDPHFGANYIGQMTSFWYIISGPKRLTPTRHAIYTIAAPNVGSMPGITQPFTLQAVSANPDTLSSSTLYVPQHFSCYISPSFVDDEVPLGHRVTLEVQLRSPYGGFVRTGGVPVALGQLIYGQSALIPAEAQINGEAEGNTPVVSTTNKSGTATFNVIDASVQGGNPVYFQAYVDPTHGYPYGYSEIVSILWK